jgi:hypothetical protein
MRLKSPRPKLPGKTRVWAVGGEESSTHLRPRELEPSDQRSHSTCAFPWGHRPSSEGGSWWSDARGRRAGEGDRTTCFWHPPPPRGYESRRPAHLPLSSRGVESLLALGTVIPNRPSSCTRGDGRRHDDALRALIHLPVSLRLDLPRACASPSRAKPAVDDGMARIDLKLLVDLRFCPGERYRRGEQFRRGLSVRERSPRTKRLGAAPKPWCAA